MPLMAMIRARAAAAGTTETRLLFSSRSWEDVIYRDELERLSGDGLRVVHTLTRLAAPRLDGLCAPPRRRDARRDRPEPGRSSAHLRLWLDAVRRSRRHGAREARSRAASCQDRAFRINGRLSRRHADDDEFPEAVDRHRKDASIRAALLERIDLPITLRQALIEGLSEALRDLVTGREWLGEERAERVLRDARDRAVVDLTLTSDIGRLRALVEQLAVDGRLTPMLIIRAVCLGNPRFLDVSLSVLAEMPTHRVISLLYDRRGTGVTAVCRRAGLPEVVVPAFRAMADTLRELDPEHDEVTSAHAGSGMIDRILERYSALTGGATDEFHALIGRLAAEAARDEARAETGGYICAA